MICRNRRYELALILAPASALALWLASGAGQAQTFGGALPGAHVRVEWEVGQARTERPVVSGYVYNDHGLTASGVRLLVESLDAGGRVVGRTVGYVDGGGVPAKGRTYFEVPVTVRGAAYRVSVGSVDWSPGGGAGT